MSSVISGLITGISHIRNGRYKGVLRSANSQGLLPGLESQFPPLQAWRVRYLNSNATVRAGTGSRKWRPVESWPLSMTQKNSKSLISDCDPLYFAPRTLEIGEISTPVCAWKFRVPRYFVLFQWGEMEIFFFFLKFLTFFFRKLKDSISQIRHVVGKFWIKYFKEIVIKLLTKFDHCENYYYIRSTK